MSTWLRADKVNPTLEELQKFKSRREKKEPGVDEDSDEERMRADEDKETELMEDLAMAQAMEPKNDVSGEAGGGGYIVLIDELCLPVC